jgi:xanthine dehydrogenase YagS FAD-binding subunit
LRPFAYARAANVDGAVAAVEGSLDARFLGGGTNLVDLMRLGVEQPGLLVDVSRLAAAGVETRPGGGLIVGAATTNSDLAADRLVRRRYPLLSGAVLHGASGQLRNRATVGGNILQRTRCLYFQDVTKPCNKRDPGSGCPAREGEHRNLAVLGWSDACVATHPSDMAVAMVAYDALVHLASPEGRRQTPLDELLRLPGDDPSRDAELGRAELITAVELPPPVPDARTRYRKVRDRASFDFATVSLGAVMHVVDGEVADVRLAFGGLAHKPWRARRAEEVLRGGPATPAAFARAADRELEQARPLRDNGYKLPLARNLLVGTLTELAG